MGLDMGLYHCVDREGELAKENQYGEQSEDIWRRVAGGRQFSDLTEAEKDTARQECQTLATSMGLDDYGCSLLETRISQKSARHPDHLCEIGYLRSSYNDGGFNQTMHRIALPDLYDLFGHDHEGYAPPIDWQASLGRVQKAIQDFDTFRKLPLADYDVWEVAENMFGNPNHPKSKAEALLQFAEELNTHLEYFQNPDPENGYSSLKGDFIPNGLPVYGMIPGLSTWQRKPCVYMIYRVDPQHWTYYQEMLEIIEENCTYVLQQADPEHYYWHWSG